MSKNEPLIRKHISPEEVLSFATPDELRAITNIILDKKHDRLLGDDNARKKLINYRSKNELHKATKHIVWEIRAIGSIGLASMLGRKGEPVKYDEVVKDVAEWLELKLQGTEKLTDIEQKILAKLDEMKLSPFASIGLVHKMGSYEFPTSVAAAAAAFKAGSTASTIAAGAMLTTSVASLPTLLVASPALAAWAVYKSKEKTEVLDLAALVASIARIRLDIASQDCEDFKSKLRACL